MRRIFLFAMGLMFTAGCGTMHRLVYDKHHTYMEVDSVNYGVSRQFPKTFTVYPFTNTSWYQEASTRAREAVWQSFSLIGPCTRLEDTDMRAVQPHTESDALKVAREENTDAVILGEVVTQDHFYLLLLAYSFVRVKLRMYDARDGRMIWKGETWSASSDWAITYLGLFGPIIEHAQWSRQTKDLYQRISMDLVHDIRPDVLSTR